MCTDAINYTSQPEASMWIYPQLKDAKLRILKYSGDADGAVPTIGTETWIEMLHWEKTSEYEPWFTDSKDLISGYIQKYDGLDFATIHGAGHMAPQWKRAQSHHLFTAWVHDEKL
jgi:carboxypeptidase C (cathepsin A)